MTKEKLIEEMKKRGYIVNYDNHVITFSGKYPFIEDMEKDITAILEELDYKGSWGVRGISKKRPARKTAPVQSGPSDKNAQDDLLQESSQDELIQDSSQDYGTLTRQMDEPAEPGEQMSLADFM